MDASEFVFSCLVVVFLGSEHCVDLLLGWLCAVLFFFGLNLLRLLGTLGIVALALLRLNNFNARIAAWI